LWQRPDGERSVCYEARGFDDEEDDGRLVRKAGPPGYDLRNWSRICMLCIESSVESLCVRAGLNVCMSPRDVNWLVSFGTARVAD
jgi:hypothetical protein